MFRKVEDKVMNVESDSYTTRYIPISEKKYFEATGPVFKDGRACLDRILSEGGGHDFIKNGKGTWYRADDLDVAVSIEFGMIFAKRCGSELANPEEDGLLALLCFARGCNSSPEAGSLTCVQHATDFAEANELSPGEITMLSGITRDTSLKRAASVTLERESDETLPGPKSPVPGPQRPLQRTYGIRQYLEPIKKRNRIEDSPDECELSPIIFDRNTMGEISIFIPNDPAVDKEKKSGPDDMIVNDRDAVNGIGGEDVEHVFAVTSDLEEGMQDCVAEKENCNQPSDTSHQNVIACEARINKCLLKRTYRRQI